MCQQLSQRQGITVGHFPACPAQSGAEHRVRAKMLHFRSPVQTETLHAECNSSKKNGQWSLLWSYIGGFWLTFGLELEGSHSVNVLWLELGSCFDFIHLEQMHGSVSWHPGVSTALGTGFFSSLSQFCCSGSGLPLAPFTNIPVGWAWVLSRHFLWVELVIQIINRRCHERHCMETSSNRDLWDSHACLYMHHTLGGQALPFLFVRLGLPFVVLQVHRG